MLEPVEKRPEREGHGQRPPVWGRRGSLSVSLRAWEARLQALRTQVRSARGRRFLEGQHLGNEEEMRTSSD